MIALTVDGSYPCQLEAPDVHSYNSSFDGGVTSRYYCCTQFSKCGPANAG